jgi:hypothetical protein
MLELTRGRPNWLGALAVAMTRPPGVPERRDAEDPWTPGGANRPRRITDDLAWLRQAFGDPEAFGLRPVASSKATAAWEHDEAGAEKLERLRDRHVLEAAGFAYTRTPAARPRTATPRFERPAGTAAQRTQRH